MASLKSQLGITKEQVEAIKPVEVYEGNTIPSGVYDVAVDTAYIRKTDSGANMLELSFILDNGQGFAWSTCVLSGDAKGNKSTYTTKNGKERNLPGVDAMQHFLDAAGTPDPTATQGDVKHKEETIKALCIQGIQGKKLKIGVTQEESLYEGNVSVRNDIKYWMTTDGKNASGEEILPKVTESIEKFPLKKLKASATASAAPAGGSEQEAATASGW